MNIPEMMIPLMNTLIQIRRVKVGDDVVRRVETVSEIAPSLDGNEPVILKQRFKWNAEKDEFYYNPPKADDYCVFNLISDVYQIPLERLEKDMERKQAILEWMNKIEVKNYSEVAKTVRSYYINPDDTYNLARLDT
jgi:flagellar protein FlaI